ncbi:MAG: TonB-dependent receptor [Pseudomonadota bacterium]
MKTHTIRQRLLQSTMIGGTALLALVAAPAAVMLTPTVAAAQNLAQGAVSGTVANQAGTPISGASVTLQSVSQGFSRTYSTDASGSFRAVALPPGQYEATVNASGFNSLVETLNVNAGGTTSFTFTVGSSDAASDVDEIVVVGVRQAVSEFDATTTGLTVNVEELSRNIPIARDASSVALLAPGVTASDGAFGNIPTIGGASAGENTYFINGLNITKFRDFTGSSIVPFEFYQTLETKTGGYSSEFGRGTGGVLNGTTKSGGNEWEFGLTAYWSPDSMRSDSPNTYLAQNNFDETSATDYIFDFGGPIIQDRLFIFGLYNFRDREATNVGAPISAANSGGLGTGANATTVTSDDPFYGAKVDFLINDDHRLEFTYFSDEQSQETDNYYVDSSGERVATFTPSTFEFGGTNWIARYTGIWTDWLTTSLSYGVNEYNEYNYSPGDAGALITDQLPGFPRRGIWGVGQPSTNEDERTILRADVDIYASLWGEHHFRVGIDQEKLEASQLLDYSGSGYSYCRPGGFANGITCTGEVTGGLWYRYQTLHTAATAGVRTDLIGQPRRVRIRAYDNDGAWSSTQNAYYLQDSWEITDRLTLNLGIRNEGFENENIAGVAFVDLQNQWAPRLGFTYDVTGDRSSKLFGFWGKYYLPVAVNTNQRLAGAEFFISDTWSLNQTGGPNDLNADGIHDTTDEPILGSLLGTSTLADGSVKPISTQVDKELDPMFVDEFILGYERQMDNGWTFGLKGTYRELGTAIDDVAIDAAVLEYCEAAGGGLSAAVCYNVWYGFHQYVLTNPGEDMVITLSGADLSNATGGLITADREITLTADQLGYPTPDRTYKAVELSMEKAFDGVWGARFSYVWSQSKGNYEGALKSDNGQTDPGLSQDFDQPGLTDGAYGFLPNHREHSFKVFGNWQATPNLNIGANLLIQSPRKFGCQGEHATDDFAYQYAAASWFCDLDRNGTLTPTPRGSQFESDWLKNLDLTFSYNLGEAFNMPGEGLTLRADIFNVFDFQSEQDFNEFGQLGDIAAAGFVGVNPNLPSSADPNYGRVTAYQAPRTVRFSIAYRF